MTFSALWRTTFRELLQPAHASCERGVMREWLERGEPALPMDGPLGLAWLQRLADIAELGAR
jgi:hypothetical protein